VLTTSGGAEEVELALSVLERGEPTDITPPVVGVLVDELSLPEAGEDVLAGVPPTTLTPESEDVVLPEAGLLDGFALPVAVGALDDDPPTTVTEEELSDWPHAPVFPRNVSASTTRAARLGRSDPPSARVVDPASMMASPF
jgi:hypothetical protein